MDSFSPSNVNTDEGVNLSAHVSGNPFPRASLQGGVTVGHTIFLILGILALLWFLGLGPLKKVRMG